MVPSMENGVFHVFFVLSIGKNVPIAIHGKW